MSKFNIVFTPISCTEGMAGAMRLRNISENLDPKKYRIKNIILTNDRKINSIDKAIDNTKIIGYNCTNPISLFLYLIKYIFAFLVFFEKNRFNIVYNYGYPNIKNILPLFLAKLFGYKIIFDIVEDNDSANSKNNWLKQINLLSSNLFFKQIHRFSSGVVVISSSLLRKAQITTKNRIPILLLPISVNLSEFQLKPKRINSTTKLFYGGSFGAKDGLATLLEAFDHIAAYNDDIILELTGKGNMMDMHHFQSKVNSLRFKDRIVNHLAVSREEYLKYMMECDILCMTRNDSRYASAGFPFKLGEMLATGNPVITSNIGDVGLYLNDMQDSFFFKANSTPDLIDRIEFILRNRNVAKEVGKRGRVVAEKKFNSLIISKKLEQFIESIFEES